MESIGEGSRRRQVSVAAEFVPEEGCLIFRTPEAEAFCFQASGDSRLWFSHLCHAKRLEMHPGFVVEARRQCRGG